MTQSDFIAVIDLGTSKIKGVVGRKNENNVISIMDSEIIDSGNSVRRGMVTILRKQERLFEKC